MKRRTLLGGAALIGIAGCFAIAGDPDNDDDNDNDEVEADEEEVEQELDDDELEEEVEEEAEDEEPEEDDPAEADEGEDIEEYAGLEILEHEFVEQDFGASIEGVVANNSGEQQSYVQVRARTYNADGQQLNNHLANTSDLDAGAEWAFRIRVYWTRMLQYSHSGEDAFDVTLKV